MKENESFLFTYKFGETTWDTFTNIPTKTYILLMK